MPSASLAHWTADRLPRLGDLDAQCAASLARPRPNPRLADENLRGYAVHLSAHFQGFCRDLYAEAADIIVSKVRVSLRPVFQDQFSAGRRLDHGNPTLANLEADFNRFGLELRPALHADPANVVRLNHLALLNTWRNIAAHQGVPPPGLGPLTLAALRAWRGSADGLATALDRLLYNHLRRLLRRPPWPA